MKLTLKLSLAFLLVSLIAIGLAAAFVWFTTASDFNQYLVDQRQAEFVAAASEYYRTHGNWQGVDAALRQTGLLPPPAQPGTDPPPPQPFALVNQDREVIVASGDFPVGQKVQKGILARGIGIESSGLVVGTVLTSGQKPARSQIEEKYLDSINRSLLVAALGSAVIAFLIGLFLARSLTRPVSDLTAAAHALAQGQLDQQVPVRSADELGELARAFNQMSADLQRLNRARQQMTADIAHDLRNPLTVIGGYLEALQDGKLKATPERFATLQAEVQQLQRLVDDLRTLALADGGELALRRQPVDPAELLAQTAAAYQAQADEAEVALLVTAGADLADFPLDPERMQQVLGNLVSNALRHTPPGGQVRLAAAGVPGGLEIRVSDTGSGIEPEILPYIFERSYRGDEARGEGHSGLGLSIARSIVELHGGKIEASSAGAGQGAEFRIVLPLEHPDLTGFENL